MPAGDRSGTRPSGRKLERDPRLRWKRSLVRVLHVIAAPAAPARHRRRRRRAVCTPCWSARTRPRARSRAAETSACAPSRTATRPARVTAARSGASSPRSAAAPRRPVTFVAPSGIERRGDVHLRRGRGRAGTEPLLCDLHTRVGVTDEQVPSWLGWTRAIGGGGARLMNRRALVAGLGTVVVLVAVGLTVLLATGGGSGDANPRASERTAASSGRRAGHGRPQHLRGPGPGRGPCLLLPRAGEDRRRRLRPARRGRGHHRRGLRGQDRLPARQLPRDHAHGRARVRAAHPPDAGEADGQPARDQRPGLLGRLRPRARHRGRAGDREGRPEGRAHAVRRSPRPATSATRARTASGTRSCA